MKKIILSLFVMILIAVVVNGVINDFNVEPSHYYEAKSSERIKIRFLSSWGGSDSKSSALETLIQEFNYSQGKYEVINESISGEDFLFNLKTDFATNNPPDVFGLWPGSDIEKLIELQMVADISADFNSDTQWKSRFKPWILDKFLSEEKIYSIPFEIIYEGIFINKELFIENKIKIPNNYAELLESIDELKQNDIIPIAYNSTPEGSFLFQNIIATIGGSTVEWDEYELLRTMDKSMNVMKELYERSAFPDNFFILDDYTRNQLFLDGKAAMIAQGSWFVDDELEANPRIDIIPFPWTDTDKTAISGIGNGNFSVSSKAGEDEVKREGCVEFIKFLTSERSWKEFSNLSGFTSSLTYESKEYSLFRQKEKIFFNKLSEIVVPIDHLIDRVMWEEGIVERFPLMLEGKLERTEVFK